MLLFVAFGALLSVGGLALRLVVLWPFLRRRRRSSAVYNAGQCAVSVQDLLIVNLLLAEIAGIVVYKTPYLLYKASGCWWLGHGGCLVVMTLRWTCHSVAAYTVVGIVADRLLIICRAPHRFATKRTYGALTAKRFGLLAAPLWLACLVLFTPLCFLHLWSGASIYYDDGKCNRCKAEYNQDALADLSVHVLGEFVPVLLVLVGSAVLCVQLRRHGAKMALRTSANGRHDDFSSVNLTSPAAQQPDATMSQQRHRTRKSLVVSITTALLFLVCFTLGTVRELINTAHWPVWAASESAQWADVLKRTALLVTFAHPLLSSLLFLSTLPRVRAFYGLAARAGCAGGASSPTTRENFTEMRRAGKSEPEEEYHLKSLE